MKTKAKEEKELKMDLQVNTSLHVENETTKQDLSFLKHVGIPSNIYNDRYPTRYIRKMKQPNQISIFLKKISF